jgi:hypothetical protein
MSTLDILSHYAAISSTDVQNIIMNIDSPSNGIALEGNYHDYFDLFLICFVPTPVRLQPFLHTS